MRIISGLYKNHLLISPDSPKTHPMGERERNAIFNSLGDLSALKVLDLFAGTGALGLEALSRSAKSATFVENFPKAVRVLQQNLRSLNLNPDQARLLPQDALTFTSATPFDVVFVDPPYTEASQIDFTRFLSLVAPDGRLVLSLPKELSVDPALLTYPILRDRTYANCRILILANRPA